MKFCLHARFVSQREKYNILAYHLKRLGVRRIALVRHSYKTICYVTLLRMYNVCDRMTGTDENFLLRVKQTLWCVTVVQLRSSFEDLFSC